MESKVLKLFTQLGFLVALVWVVASFVVKTTAKKVHEPEKHRHSRGDRWATPICQSETAQKASFGDRPIAPGQV